MKYGDCKVANREPDNLSSYIISKSGSSPKELVDEKDSRGQGFKDSSEMLKNYKELKVWQKSYQL